MTINQLIAYLAAYPGEAELLIKNSDGTGGSLIARDIQPLEDPEAETIRWVMIARDSVISEAS